MVQSFIATATVSEADTHRRASAKPDRAPPKWEPHVRDIELRPVRHAWQAVVPFLLWTVFAMVLAQADLAVLGNAAGYKPADFQVDSVKDAAGGLKGSAPVSGTVNGRRQTVRMKVLTDKGAMGRYDVLQLAKKGGKVRVYYNANADLEGPLSLRNVRVLRYETDFPRRYRRSLSVTILVWLATALAIFTLWWLANSTGERTYEAQPPQV